MGIKLTARSGSRSLATSTPSSTRRRLSAAWAGARRTRSVADYSKQDWQQMKAEAASVEQPLVAAMGEGEAADGTRATGLAEEHRAHIDRWFYRCAPEMHVALTQMYVEDVRFRAHYEELAPGLATYIRDAATRTRLPRAVGGAADVDSPLPAPWPLTLR